MDIFLLIYAVCFGLLSWNYYPTYKEVQGEDSFQKSFFVSLFIVTAAFVLLALLDLIRAAVVWFGD